MKFRRQSRSRAAQLSMTSMLDVIFLLLCFFVTMSVFSQWENEISIKLPGAETADEPNRLPGEIVVNLSKSGVMSINGKALDVGQLKDRLSKVARFYPGQSVIIRADKEVQYEKVVGLIDACREAQIWNFSFATDGEGK